jgi:L,D-transpeptidase YbiS
MRRGDVESVAVEIVVSLSAQTLELRRDGIVLCQYAVSTARNGAGEERDSECTPRGKHLIRAKIGAGCPPGTVFVGRRPTGETWSPQLEREQPGRDWILTRILWLSGTEPGVNRLANVDTMRRYIYIHGTPHENEIGKPVSHGCIRMCNEDIVELFDRVEVGTHVTIQP